MTQRRVEVHYFPKRPRPVRAPTLEAQADPSYSRTVEFRPDFDADPPEPRAKTPPPQKALSKPAPKAAPKSAARAAQKASAKPRTRREKRRRITLDFDTDPALRYHVGKLDELLSSRSPVEALRGMTRHELAEMSLFGHQLFEAGKLEEARVVFEGLVGLDLADAFPHTMLGTVYLAQGRQDRAAALFDAALALDEKDLAARVYRAELRLAAGEVRPAVTALSEVVEKGPLEDPFVQRAQKLLEMAQKVRRRR